MITAMYVLGRRQVQVGTEQGPKAANIYMFIEITYVVRTSHMY